MRGVGLSRGGFWGFLSLAFALGLILGVGLLLWQRAAAQSTVKGLERKLAAKITEASDADSELARLKETLASTEASVQALAAENTSLTTELASATTALAAAKAAAITTTTASGPIAITGHSASPTPVPAGGTYTVTATVKGGPAKVTVRVASMQKSIRYNKTFALSRASTSGGVETWQATLTGPPGGHYHYYVYAYTSSSKTPVAKNLSGAFSSN